MKRSKPKRRGKPATQEQRNAFAFKAIEIEWTWDNHEWNDTIPQIRLAIALLGKDRAELKDAMEQTVKAGLAPEMLENWSVLKKHLKRLIEIVDCALGRSFLVLEELGYSPDKPPPDTAVATAAAIN
jgi:hypothetical protein